MADAGDIGPEVFDIYSSHLASCISDENDGLELEIERLYPFRDYLSSVEIRVDGCTIKLPGLDESTNVSDGSCTEIGSSYALSRRNGRDVPGIPVSSLADGNLSLYISNQLVVRLPEAVDGDFGRRGGVNVCMNPYDATLRGKSETIDVHGRLKGLTEEHRGIFDPVQPSHPWTTIRGIPGVTFHPTRVDVGRHFEDGSQKLIVSSARDVQKMFNCERLDTVDLRTQLYKEQLEDVKQVVSDIESLEENEDSIDMVANLRERISELTRELERNIRLMKFARENLLKFLSIHYSCDFAGKEDPTSDECDEELKAALVVFGIAGGKGMGLARRRVNLQEQVRVLNRIKTTVLFGRLHTASGDFTAIDITKGKEIDGGEGWVIGLEGIFGSVRLRNLSHLHLCLCGVITRDAAVTVVMLPNTPFEALAQYRYSNGVTVSCALQLQFSETNERVDLAIGEQLYHRMGGGLELAVEYQAKVIPITVEVPMDNSIVAFARRMIEAESK
mmetsp:Transcript_24014/g.54982  ORF Transcript_24014/g.54982 Transcript_24014/m.54982 type:complete len:502 (+) Transcript_24014:234-1739(+)